VSGPRIGGDDGLVELAVQDLERAYALTGERWRDQSREDFAHDHLDQLRLRAKDALRTMREIEALLRDVVRQTRDS
jgi:hypothetical protein